MKKGKNMANRILSILLLIIFFLFKTVTAQDFHKMDSLKRLLQEQPGNLTALVALSKQLFYFDHDRAKRICLKVIELGKAPQDSKQLSTAYNQLSMCYIYENKVDSELLCDSMAIFNAQISGNKGETGLYMVNHALNLIRNNDYKVAQLVLIMAAPLGDYEQDSIRKAHFFINLNNTFGNLYQHYDLTDSALLHFYLAISIAERIKDTLHLPFMYLKVAEIEERFGDKNKAIFNANRIKGLTAGSFNIKINKEDYGLACIRLSSIYKNINRFDSAEKENNSAFDLFNNDTFLKGDLSAYYFNEAEIQLKRQQYAAAMYFYRKVIASSPDISLIKGIAYSGMAEVYSLQKQYDQAEAILLKGLSIFTKLDSKYEIHNTYLDLAQFAKDAGNNKKAVKYYAQFAEINANYLKYVQDKNVEREEARYVTRIKDMELRNDTLVLKAQQTDIINKKKEIEHKKIIIYCTSGSILLLVVIVILLLYLRKTIIKQKHEILHCNKDYLGILVSLFQKQSVDPRYADDPLFTAATIENKAKLMAIQEVYNLLYETNENSIDLIAYLQKICDLKEKISVHPIQFQSEISNIHLSYMAVCRMGLIINELTTNAIMHGLKENPQPEITVLIKRVYKQKIVIFVKDNGSGLPGDFNLRSIRENGGLDFVRDQVKTFRGSLKAYNNENGIGACFEITLKKFELRHEH